MESDVESRLGAVCDEETFIAFLSALAADRFDEVAKEKTVSSEPYGPGANGWENGTIEAFLEAAAAWASTSNIGYDGYEKPTNTWKRCAEIIYAGKVYE